MSGPEPSTILVHLTASTVASDKVLPAMKAVSRLDLDRFAGRWHEIARLPAPAQRQTDRNVTANLIRQGGDDLAMEQAVERPDGTVHSRSALIRRRYPIEEPGQFRRLRAPTWLGWLPWAWDDWWVIALDRDDRWMMIGRPDRRGLWMFSRERSMERGVLEMLKAKARGLGYDLAPLIISGELRSYQPV